MSYPRDSISCNRFQRGLNTDIGVTAPVAPLSQIKPVTYPTTLSWLMYLKKFPELPQALKEGKFHKYLHFWFGPTSRKRLKYYYL